MSNAEAETNWEGQTKSTVCSLMTDASSYCMRQNGGRAIVPNKLTAPIYYGVSYSYLQSFSADRTEKFRASV